MIQSDLQTILGVIYGYYTQYTVLGPISKTAFNHTGASELDIYIDLGDIMVHISNIISKNTMVIPHNACTAIVSAIINMCGHYRNFYRNAFGVDTTFFIVNRDDNCAEKHFCQEYSPPCITTEATALRVDVINTLSRLMPYIPKAYLISTRFDFNSTAFGISEKLCYENSHPKMIISKDPIVSAIGPKGFWLLRPKKYRGGDRSIIVPPEDAFMYYYHLMTKRTLPLEVGVKLSSLLDIYMVLTGAPSRGLKGTMRYSTAVAKLIQCIDDQSNSFTNSKNLINEDFLSMCDAIGINDPSIREKLIRRFMVLKTPSTFSFNFIAEGAFEMFVVDFYDKELMFKLNETAFREYPLDLNSL